MKRVNPETHDYVVGALNVNNNHWNAFIIDFVEKRFIVADPMLSGNAEDTLTK